MNLKKFWIPALIFLITFSVYLANLPIDYKKDNENRLVRRLLPSQDTIQNTFLPYLLIKEKTLYFDPVINTINTLSDNRPYFLIPTEKGYYPAYPILTGLMALPVYIVPLLLNKIPELTYHENILKLLVLGRITASFYSALSVTIFYLMLKQIYKNKKWTLLFTAFYAFGTCTWSVASRGLWQHTTIQFINSLIILTLLASVKNEKLIPLVGFLLGIGVLIRPTNIILALVITIYVFIQHREKLNKYILAAIPCVLFLVIHNQVAFGSPLTEGYGAREDFSWSTPLLISLPGYAFSPARSFLLISPPLALAYFGIYTFFKKEKSKSTTDKKHLAIMRYLGIAFILSLLMLAKWYTWDGAPAFGYRMLVDFLPIVGLLAFDVTQSFGKKGKLIIAILIIFSIYVHQNAVLNRKSRCGKDHTWTVYCLLPPKEKPQY